MKKLMCLLVILLAASLPLCAAPLKGVADKGSKFEISDEAADTLRSLATATGWKPEELLEILIRKASEDNTVTLVTPEIWRLPMSPAAIVVETEKRETKRAAEEAEALAKWKAWKDAQPAPVVPTVVPEKPAPGDEIENAAIKKMRERSIRLRGKIPK